MPGLAAVCPFQSSVSATVVSEPWPVWGEGAPLIISADYPSTASTGTAAAIPFLGCLSACLRTGALLGLLLVPQTIGFLSSTIQRAPLPLGPTVINSEVGQCHNSSALQERYLRVNVGKGLVGSDPGPLTKVAPYLPAHPGRQPLIPSSISVSGPALDPVMLAGFLLRHSMCTASVLGSLGHVDVTSPGLVPVIW